MVNGMAVSFEDFSKLEIRIGEVLEAEKIIGSRNLIRMTVDFGLEKRQSIAGLFPWYKPEELVGKSFAFILNLQRKKFMNFESQCMVLAAEDSEGNVVLLVPEKKVNAGSQIH